jgi:hypothetical protein
MQSKKYEYGWETYKSIPCRKGNNKYIIIKYRLGTI